MTEREREEVALFRYGVISDFLHGEFQRGERQRCLESKALRPWQPPDGEKCRISISTMRQWIKRYGRGGVDGLKPQKRKDGGQARALEKGLEQALLEQRQQHPDWGVPEILRQVRAAGLIGEQEGVALSTVYRLIGRSQREEKARVDRRKYGFEELLGCVPADVMYGPKVVGGDGKVRRSYLHVLLDDCSRMVLNGEFRWSERVSDFAQVLKGALMRRGYAPQRLYTDNGAAFISHHLQWVCAQLGMQLIHTRPGVPEGRGKVERFFRTVREQFLVRVWREGLSFQQLNAEFWQWVELEYHRSPHQGLEGQSPLETWARQAQQLVKCRRIEADSLDLWFRHRAQRGVAKDRTFRLNGRCYQAAVELVGEKIEVFYDPENLQSVEVKFQGKSYGLARWVELQVNRQVSRGIRFDQEGRPA